MMHGGFGIDRLLAAPGAGVLVVAPHPDDEAIGAGVLIQRAVRLGASVMIVFITDGDNNPWPQRVIERRIRIGAVDRERWGARRRSEALASAAELGVTASAMRNLRLPDLGVTERLVNDTGTVLSVFERVVADASPTLVVLPSLKDSHPDHSGAHVLAAIALARVGSLAQLISYVVHGTPDESGVECTASPELLARKERALSAHRSQLALSERRMFAYARRPERFSWGLAPNSSAGDPSLSAVGAPEDSSSRNAVYPHAYFRLPWRVSYITAAYCDVIVVTLNGASRVAITSEKSRSTDATGLRCVRDEAGRLSLYMSGGLPLDSSVFVKLTYRGRSPWIYDRWGWTMFGYQPQPES